KKSGLRKKLIRLNRNLGFTGGNNVGFAARDKESKYVLLLNNDALLLQQGLKTLIEYAENDDRIAGLQGVVLRYGTRIIDTGGGYVDEMIQSYMLGDGKEYPWILRKPIRVSYASGSCSLYKSEKVLECLGDKLFIEDFFGYGDDNVLGLMLWSNGYEIRAVPDVVAEHARSLTFRGYGIFSAYLSIRNRVALAQIANIKYKDLVLLHTTRNVVTSTKLGARVAQNLLRALVDGLRLGKSLRKRGFFINVYKAPLIKIPPNHVIKYFASKGALRRYCEDWIIKNLKSLTVE
ncbi:MAG: glycosyltransferase, partial [Thaumarchaeota archaeon]|nr:glycosyltransferase [Nitrososphaerota archaeon]